MKVRYTAGEFRVIEERAATTCNDLATYVRKASLGSSVVAPKVPVVNLHAMGDLNRLGNNLNQLVRLIHSGELPPGLEGVLRLLIDAVAKLRTELLAGMGFSR
ncbi:MAG TPA: plasmid mobilization relaxosome protein MobC [Thermoanaerobaculia bacterium]|nr:plasmid mobilization relaxosome protein MobC [Thermoanaerobaculia bacterium]